MPVMNGIEFLLKLKSLAQAPPHFIFISGYTKLSKEEALEMGAIDLLKKPIKPKILVEYISTIFEDMAQETYEQGC